MTGDRPSYLALHASGELAERAARALELVRECAICPRECGVDRAEGREGFCGVGESALVCSAAPHFGEERPLVGSGGSGTIFFAGCNLSLIHI